MLMLLVFGSIVSTVLCMPGGFSVVDKNDTVRIQEYIDMLTESEANGLLGSFDRSNLLLTQVETQVVAGQNVKYTFSKPDGSLCHLTIFDQSWTKTRLVKENTCDQHKQARGMLAGGYSTVDAGDMTNYTEKLAKLQSGGLLNLDPYTVQKVETQVVSGVNVRYTLLKPDGSTCQIVVWEQVWLKNQQVTRDECSKQARRQLLGGYNKADVNSPDVQQCMSMSVERVNAMSNNMFRMVNVGIVSAEQQVVAGMNYAVTFQMGESTCMKSDYMTGKVTNCPLNANSVMAQSTWKGHCFKGLDGKLTFSGVDMNEEPSVNMQLDNHHDLKLKPVSAGKAKLNVNVAVNDVKVRKTKDKLLKGKAFMKAEQEPVVNLLRKKRDVNFLIERLDNAFGKSKDINDIIDEHHFVNRVKDLIGEDGIDKIKHSGKILGGDGHDLVNHVEKILGGDDHDLIDHGKKLIGGDDHDLIDHGKKLIGGDDHDLIDHGKKLIGGDDHDLIDHGKKLIGGDDHDLIDHGKKLIGGGDDHDYLDHGKKLIGGGDDHDYLDHGKKLIGGDDHDLIDHGKKLLNIDDRDLLAHKTNMLGGGDNHDYLDHGKNLIGGGDHDYKPHGNRDTLKVRGRDGHDYCSREMFNEFKAKFNKLYGSAKEEEKRYTRFCINMRMARKIQETEQGSAIYGATKFADFTKDEFQQYVGKRWDTTANKGMKKAAIPRGSAPDSFDWRDHGAVTPVKNQGSCGSCWAFSTTGNIEGQWAIKKKKLISLSEQELVDCDKVDEGCNGGLPSQAYKEIERLGGLETESEYSYKGEDEKCVFNKTDVKVYINDSVSISSDEEEMASWLAANGPISIGINAFAMQFYMGGVSHPWKIFCNPKDLDHGVLIVGYGVQDDKPYWVVKNSWGPDWGEKGYYLVYRGAGVCGLNTMCTSAVVD